MEKIKSISKNDISFEYVKYGLKIKATTTQDHKNTSKLLRDDCVEFYTSDPSPGHIIHYEGPSPAITHEEIKSGLNSADVPVCHVRQVKRNVVDKANLGNFCAQKRRCKHKSVRNLFHFTIRFEEFKARRGTVQCFRCQNFGHKAEFCNLKTQCVKCTGHPNMRDSQKPGTHLPSVLIVKGSTRLTTGAAP